MRLSASQRLGRPASNSGALRRLIGAALAAMALWSWLPAPVAAQTGDYQAVGSMAVYLGVMPAELIQGHTPGRPESRMHGGPPENRHAEHIVVALFDKETGTRIEDATVSATIIHHGGLDPIKLDLEPMLSGGVTTYGGFVTFPADGAYSIELVIRRPDGVPPTQVTFAIDHRES